MGVLHGSVMNMREYFNYYLGSSDIYQCIVWSIALNQKLGSISLPVLYSVPLGPRDVMSQCPLRPIVRLAPLENVYCSCTSQLRHRYRFIVLFLFLFSPSFSHNRQFLCNYLNERILIKEYM